MCGIGGILNLGSTRSLNIISSLQAMARQMHNRGPDDEGYYLGAPYDAFFLGNSTPSVLRNFQEDINSVNQCRSVGLVHRRLSIVDLSIDSHQPMESLNGRYVITFNGEIYNYQDLAEYLCKKSINLHTSGDTEVLLELYALLGVSSLKLLNGDFAFAIWDKKEKSLFCARDRVGIKPFYYTKSNGRFLFASDIKTIIASNLYTPKLDANGLMLSFAFGMAPRPTTAFKEVKALEPGTWLKVLNSGNIEVNRYWSIPVGTYDDSITELDAIELVEAELAKSVRLRTRADVPVGIFMSGGIDSTLVSAFSADQGASAEAYTLGFSKDSCLEDEVLQASTIAKHIRIKHNVQKVDPIDYISEIERINCGYEEPFYNISPNYMISKFVAGSGIKVALNGLGGDELFAGYDYYKWCNLWERLKPVGAFFRLLERLPNTRVKRISQYLSCKSATNLHSLLFLKFSIFDLKTLFNATDCDITDPVREISKIYADKITFSNAVDALSFLDLKNYVGNHHVERSDQFTMMHSIEGRFPFLDHNLIEASFSIPPRFKTLKNERKYLLRKLSRKFLPKDSLNMPKKGFSLPLRSWMSKELSGYVKDNIKELCERDIFDPAIIHRWYYEYEQKQRPYTHIWQLVATNVWVKKFILSPTFGR